MKSKSLSVFFLILLPLAGTGSLPWKHTVSVHGYEPFAAHEEWLGRGYCISMTWVRFTLVLPGEGQDGPLVLYFQDSRTMPFHYEFAVTHLAGFAGLSREEFDQLTLYAADRRAVLGAVMFIRETSRPVTVGIQLIGSDPFSREEIAMVYDHVLESLEGSANVPHYYIPMFDQIESARSQEEWLAGQGIELASMVDWSPRQEVHTPGWALGRLVEVSGTEVAAASGEGRLLPTDILLVDRVSAEIPLVAGVIAREPVAPHSRPVVLARSWNIPFVHVSDDSIDFDSLVGEIVAFSAADTSSLYNCERYIDVRPLDAEADGAVIDAILSLKDQRAPELPTNNSSNVRWLTLDDRWPEEVAWLAGGAAERFSILRRSIPENSPVAIAFTFDLWRDFLANEVPGRGRSLGEEIAARLKPFERFSPEISALRTELAAIRTMMRDEARFSSGQESEILAVLSDHFPEERRIQLYGSTNMEAAGPFLGTGFYDGCSGCLLDDLSSGTSGPTHCDPTNPSKQSVLRAIRCVYASFYEEAAFLQRLRLGVDEGTAGIGVLAHYAYPESDVLANGIGVLKDGLLTLVTQKGGEPVTNPSGDAVAEIAVADLAPCEMGFEFFGRSNLLPVGKETVLNYDSDYRELVRLYRAAYDEFVYVYPEFEHRDFEFEYKKLASAGVLEITQLRPLGLPPELPEVRYFFSHGVTLEVYQGLSGNAFSLHRANARWHLSAQAHQLEFDAGLPGLIASVTYKRPVDGAWVTWEGAPDLWHGDSGWFEGGGNDFTKWYSWNEPIAGMEATRSLGVSVGIGHIAPWLFLDQMGFQLVTDYPRNPLPWDLWQEYYLEREKSAPGREPVRLVPVPRADGPRDDDRLEKRRVHHAGILAEMSFFWPPLQRGIVTCDTHPLVAWDAIHIYGLTNEPIVVTEPLAMTYRPDWVAVGERFVVEPRLDPSVPKSTLRELEGLGIIAILVCRDSPRSDIFFIGPLGEVWDPLEAWFGPLEYPLEFEIFPARNLRAPWFGEIFVPAFPFIWHESLGWLYLGGGNTGGLWFRDVFDGLGWIWTSTEHYPFLYHVNDAHWVYYRPENPPGLRWFHFQSNAWQGP